MVQKLDGGQELASLREPKPGIIRERIATVRREIPRLALAFQYLTSTRASETVGRRRGHEANYGIQVEDMSRQEWAEPASLDPKTGAQLYRPHPAIVFTQGTAKRMGIPRAIALPLEPIYEPWAQVLGDYFDQVGTGPAFPITRQVLHEEAREAFAGLAYPIETYRIPDETKPDSGETVQIDRHFRDFATHGLRHIRTTELADVYGFDAEERAQYCGWTPAAARIPAMIARYDMKNWRRYFPKLLRPSPYSVELRRGRL